MPLLKEFEEPGGTIAAVWEISESEALLTEMLGEKPPAEIKAPQKIRQWLGSRLLLKHLLKTHFQIAAYEIEKTPRGEPFLVNHEIFMSISHCENYAAVALHRNKKTGIDIEVMTDRIHRVAHKFVNEAESRYLTPDDQRLRLYQLWCAKEAVFKRYGKGDVDFRKHIDVRFDTTDPFFMEVGFALTGEQISIRSCLLNTQLILAYAL